MDHPLLMDLYNSFCGNMLSMINYNKGLCLVVQCMENLQIGVLSLHSSRLCLIDLFLISFTDRCPCKPFKW